MSSKEGMSSTRKVSFSEEKPKVEITNTAAYTYKSMISDAIDKTGSAKYNNDVDDARTDQSPGSNGINNVMEYVGQTISDLFHPSKSHDEDDDDDR